MTGTRTRDVQNAFAGIIRQQLQTAAGADGKLSLKDQKKLDPFVQKAADAVRQANPGKTPKIDAVMDRALGDAANAWAAFNPPGGRDGQYFSQAEVKALEKANPELGKMTRAALEIAAKKPVGTITLEAARTAAQQGLTAYLKDTRSQDADWKQYFPSSWAENVSRGILDRIAAFAAGQPPDVEVQEKADRFILMGRGPYDLYTEVEVARKDAKILRVFVEID